MKPDWIRRPLAVLVLSVAVGSPVLLPQQPPELTDAQMEEFLLKAKVIRTRGVSTGITGIRRATLSDGRLTHDASIQSVDIYKLSFPTAQGTELHFRDSYKYNIAAYRLDRLLNLNMIPVSVERKIGGETAAVTWWVDDVKMMEKERSEKNIQPPKPQEWTDQVCQTRIFNELVYNTDANLGNLLITSDWKLVMIDFTRAFRTHRTLRAPENLGNCKIDRRFYDGLSELNEEALLREMKDVLRKSEIKGLIARRRRILLYLDEQIAKKGEGAVICDKPGH